jgi:hypothetical protein
MTQEECDWKILLQHLYVRTVMIYELWPGFERGFSIMHIRRVIVKPFGLVSNFRAMLLNEAYTLNFGSKGLWKNLCRTK